MRKEEYIISFSNNDPHEDLGPRMSRIPDGVWTSKTGPQNTRLSAVFIVRNFRLWSLGKTIGCLYHNPWSLYSGVSLIVALPKAIPVGAKMETQAGKSIIEILGIDLHEAAS